MWPVAAILDSKDLSTSGANRLWLIVRGPLFRPRFVLMKSTDPSSRHHDGPRFTGEKSEAKES